MTEKRKKVLWYALSLIVLIGGISLAEHRTIFVGLCYLLMIVYLVVQIRRKEMTIGKVAAFVGTLIVIEMLRR